MPFSESTRRPQANHRAPRPPTPKPASPSSEDARRVLGQHAVAQAASPSIADVIALQQMQGNRAVSQLLQRKLTVGPADDTHEREAERVASSVMNGSPSQRADTGEAVGRPAAAPTGSTGGGAPLPHATRLMMESRFGADLSHVRVHTGGEPAQVNRMLDAEAFTHQNHIYMGAGQYNAHSHAGQQLLAHELTHVVQQTGIVQRKSNKQSIAIRGRLPANRVSPKRKKLYLDFIRMKRLDPQFDKIIFKKLGMKKAAEKKGDQSGGTYGHWWTEIGDLKGNYPGTWHAAESYGWWPAQGLGGLKQTFGGVEGQLNQGDRNDPHHGEDVSGSQMFHPVMELDPAADNYVATRTKVISDVRKFAKGYHGKWNWVFGWGKNCHTFQQALKTRVGLHYQKGDGWFKKPDNVEGVAEAAKREQEEAQRQKWNASNPGVDFKLKVDVPMKHGMMGEGAEVMVPAGSIVRVLTEGIDFNRLQGWNLVLIGWDQQYYSAYLDDVRKHADRV